MTGQFTYSNDFGPSERILNTIVFLVSSCYNFINKLTGYIGLLLLMPLMAFASLILWGLLKYYNFKLNKLIIKVFNSIDTSDTRSLRLAHNALKRNRLNADDALKKIKIGESYFIINPLVGQVKRSRNLYINAEDRLHKSAYPHMYQPLSEVQIHELDKYSLQFKDIWEDSDYVNN